MYSKILSRLLKQSAIPAVVAISYSIFRHWPISGISKIPLLFEGFVTSFFLVSWFSGQVLRTSKQVHDEERFNTIINRLDGFDAKSLEAFKRAAEDHIDIAADYAHLQTTVKMLVPNYIKGMVYAMHIDRGDDPQESYVRPWAVTEEELEASRMELNAASKRITSTNN